MANIEYYKDIDHEFLLAYERSTEFFVMYVSATNEWKICNISFSNFVHDYCFKEISKEEAIRITNGNLPETMLAQYSDMINNNLCG